MNARAIIGLLAIVTLLGCDQRAWFDKFIPDEENEFARNYVELVRGRDFNSAEALLMPDLQTVEAKALLEQVADYFPSEEPSSVQTVGANTIKARTDSQFTLEFEYGYQNNWLLVTVVLYKKDGETFVKGLHVAPMAGPLKDINRFTFAGKGPAHYIFFVFAIIIPLFTVYALVRCFQTPIPKRKWLWIVFVALGFGHVTLNWSTGEVIHGYLHVALLGAGFGRAGPFAPWTVSLSFPLGAVTFLRRRKRWLSVGTDAGADTTVNDPTAVDQKALLAHRDDD